METYEKLGAFYLGREYDIEEGKIEDDLVLYDAKDLTTHALCVGMTGSGKTGLCIGLLEEAAIDGIPAIVIDPKGDIGNLLLTFPKLRAQDFRPWVDPGEAQRKGMSVDEYAKNRADLWRKGLGQWGQDGERIARFREAADVAIYTPGSTAGLPLSVLRSFTAPAPEILDDSEAMRERVSSAVSGLLTLMGVDADPIRSREHILLSNIIDRSWRDGRDLELGDLIRQLQDPPFKRIGVIDLESFFPAKDRFELAMLINNLLASPGFASWMEGDPLDIHKLLYTADGRPRISILSIAHLSDSERMFFVTLLLNEVVAWMRSQSGTSSLRALLYMDEVFGFFPPTRNPPSKVPMLTLLKQARAFGLGCVLATQNPVDLDYKGLSNIGTWFLGRLQTERDKMRVMDGLEGAAATTGAAFDKSRMEQILSGLGSRVFLMNNVHEDGPVVFHTRWVLSYLRGPLTRVQIKELMSDRRAREAASAPGPDRISAPTPSKPERRQTGPPTLPPGIKAKYVAVAKSVPEGDRLVYRPALVGVAEAHYVRVAAKIDEWKRFSLLAPLDDDTVGDPWAEATELESAPSLEKKPDGRGEFDELPSAATQKKSYTTWTKSLKDTTYRSRELAIWHCKMLKRYSDLGVDGGVFRVELRDALRERRDLAVEKLRGKYGKKIETIKERIRKADQKIEREEAQYKQERLKTVLSIGTTILGAVLGRRSSTKAASTMSGAGAPTSSGATSAGPRTIGRA